MPPAWSASIEWLCPHTGIVRLHPTAAGTVGDPYRWACTVARDGDVAELKGVGSGLPAGAAAVRAIDRALADHGIARRFQTRKREGHPDRVVRKRTSRPARTGIPA